MSGNGIQTRARDRETEIMMGEKTAVLAAIMTLSWLGMVPAEAGDWPQFRGPNCSGISSSKAAMPVEFSPKSNLLWSAEIGDGVGCPIVAGGRVFVSALGDPGHVALHAYSAKSGRFLWGKQWNMGDATRVHKTNSLAATTPASDGKRVYFYHAYVGMVALDARDGKIKWHREMPVPYYVFDWGPAMSPVLHKGKVLFVQDDDLHPAFYALDARTGKLLWKDDRSDQAVNYSHPIIARGSQGDEIVVAGTGMLIGYDPDTGKRLWHARTLLRNIKTTPVTFGGTVYVSLQSGGIANQWLASADAKGPDVGRGGNGDGKLSKAEMQAMVGKRKIPEAFFKRTFDKGDLNKDGVLEGIELDKAFLSEENFAGAKFDTPSDKAGDQSIHAVRAGGRGDVTGTHVVWKHSPKQVDHIVSPLVVDGRMLLVKGGGIATGFEISGGEKLWGPRRINNTCEYFASPITADGKIYIAGENGYMVVLKSSGTFEILAKNNMGEAIVGTPAIADGRLVIRTRGHLYCVGLK